VSLPLNENDGETWLKEQLDHVIISISCVTRDVTNCDKSPMVRSYFLRLPIFRALPRVTAPLLPLTSRLRIYPSIPASFTNPHLSTSRLFHHFPARLASSPPPSPGLRSPAPDASLAQKLRHVIKLYGWYALGVYIVLSALDFSVAFAGVNLLGAEQVSRLASSIKDLVTKAWPSKPPEPGQDDTASTSHPSSHGQEGIWAMLVVAYTLHKTIFLPVRVGLTAALTPRFVRWLGRRGWVGGDGARRAAIEMRERLRNSRNRQ